MSIGFIAEKCLIVIRKLMQHLVLRATIIDYAIQTAFWFISVSCPQVERIVVKSNHETDTAKGF